MPARKTTASPAIERIRAIAHQIRIDAGMPDGDADLHWALAEAIAARKDAEAKPAKAPARRKAA